MCVCALRQSRDKLDGAGREREKRREGERKKGEDRERETRRGSSSLPPFVRTLDSYFLIFFQPERERELQSDISQVSSLHSIRKEFRVSRGTRARSSYTEAHSLSLSVG